MSRAPRRIRMSVALEQLVGLVGANASAAHRALLLLGAQAAGYDLHPCRSDIGRLLGEDLAEPVQQRLADLYAACRTRVGQPAFHAPPPVPPVPPTERSLPSFEDDPISAIGIEV